MKTPSVEQIQQARETLKRGLTEAENIYRRQAHGSSVAAALGRLEGAVDAALLFLGDKEHWDSRAPKSVS